MNAIFIAIRLCAPNFIKIGQFSLTWRSNDFKMVAVRHLGFSKIAVYVVAFFGMPFCFTLQTLAEIGRSLAELCPKTIFKMAAVHHLEFKKN